MVVVVLVVVAVVHQQELGISIRSVTLCTALAPPLIHVVRVVWCGGVGLRGVGCTSVGGGHRAPQANGKRVSEVQPHLA